MNNSGCCPDCDKKEFHITFTPLSYVEIGNGFEKEEIGIAKTTKIYGLFYSDPWRQFKRIEK